MGRLSGEDHAKIEYQYSEAINVAEVQAEEKAVFGHPTENIMEITLVYAGLQKSISELCEIDSTTWKQKFVDWANEFESQWQEGRDSEYLEDIEKFARHKIFPVLFHTNTNRCNGAHSGNHQPAIRCLHLHSSHSP